MGLLLSCAGKRPVDLGVRDSRLAPCPSSPNCVSSDAQDESHHVDALRLEGDPDTAWSALREIVSAMPGTTLTEETSHYLRAECESRLLGFVDDLELHLRRDEGVVAIRSASRLGYSDMGVNRRRVEQIRERLASLAP